MHGKRKRGWDEEETASLLAMVEQGLTSREIARRLGRSRQAIGYRLNCLGIRRSAASRANVEERFWSYVPKGGPDECWEWAGYRDPDGYGSFAMWPTRIGAHRFSFELAHGHLAEGECARHQCDNPPCVNPAHLERGSLADNNRDKTARGRNATGEHHGMARYTVDQVLEVKRRLALGETRVDIQAATWVPITTIATIAIGKQWKGVGT